jgi:hypothetical protein
VWLPLAYMGIKALERYGFHELADDLAGTLVRHMVKAWREFEPHTIWETYSPTEAKPSTLKRPDDGLARPDFCGWSALGPISLMIENVIGLNADARIGVVTWRLRQAGRHGVRNLRFGQITADLVYDGRETVVVTTNQPFTLQVNGVDFAVLSGENCFKIAALPGRKESIQRKPL